MPVIVALIVAVKEELVPYTVAGALAAVGNGAVLRLQFGKQFLIQGRDLDGVFHTARFFPD